MGNGPIATFIPRGRVEASLPGVLREGKLLYDYHYVDGSSHTPQKVITLRACALFAGGTYSRLQAYLSPRHVSTLCRGRSLTRSQQRR